MLSIEYGHMYGDETVGPEQEETMRMAGDRAGHFCVLVDDYNVVAHDVDWPALKDALGADSICSEGDLVDQASELLGLLQGRIRSSNERYIEKHGKLTCSLLTAAWYLARLGYFDNPPDRVTGERMPAAEELLNVLPHIYEDVEREALAVIAVSPWSDTLAKIDYIWTDIHNEQSWDRFKPAAYLEHNYRQVRDVDRRIATELRQSWQRIGPVDRYLEIGAGPNLYPILASLPYARELDITDFSRANLDYLYGQQEHLDPNWLSFDGAAYLPTQERMSRRVLFQELLQRANIYRLDLFEAPDSFWDVVSAHFVAESITSDPDEFARACAALRGACRDHGHLLASFMLGSTGYTVAGVRFPAVPIDVADIGEQFEDDEILRLVTPQHEHVRDGYEGMAYLHVQVKHG